MWCEYTACISRLLFCFFFFFFNDTATTEIYTLSLHDALPICVTIWDEWADANGDLGPVYGSQWRSEEHTSELQSRLHLVCRLLLEKKKKKKSFRTFLLSQPVSCVILRPLYNSRPLIMSIPHFF